MNYIHYFERFLLVIETYFNFKNKQKYEIKIVHDMASVIKMKPRIMSDI